MREMEKINWKYYLTINNCNHLSNKILDFTFLITNSYTFVIRVFIFVKVFI